MDQEFRIEGTGPYILYLNGVIRTVVDDFWLDKESTYQFDPNFVYKACRTSSLQERVDGKMGIKIEDGSCVDAENPRVSLDGQDTNVAHILNLSMDDLDLFDEYSTNGEEFILQNHVIDSVCDKIPSVPELGDEPIFGRLSDGSWLQFDPRIVLETNTIEDPLADGGRATQLSSGFFCSNVPKNFLNEDHCQLSSSACTSASRSADNLEVLLNNKTITELNTLTNRYVYALQGLNVVDKSDESQKLKHPCTKGLRSRWIPKDAIDCNPTDLRARTNSTLHELLSSSRDSNTFLRDIFFPQDGRCNNKDTDPEIEIFVSGICWQRVHHDFMSIWDMTYWVSNHPGGPVPIQKFSENNGTILVFPNGFAGHTMDRWYQNFQKFTYIGRFGDRLNLIDLPNELRTEKVIAYYRGDDTSEGGKVLVCGSDGEVSNIKQNGIFDMNFDRTNLSQTYGRVNRNIVWYMISIHAKDQLRQRVAWALAQVSSMRVKCSCITDSLNFRLINQTYSLA